MTEKEIKLAADLLLLASDQFANHGCNDMPDEYFKDWTLEERQTLVRQYWEWNGTPQEYNPDFLHIGDSFLMYFLAEKLKKHTVSEIVESFTQPPTPVWVSVEKHELREQWYNVFALCNIGTPDEAWTVTRAYCMPDTRSKWFDADMDVLPIEVTHVLDFQ